jgi:hypothetical protein
MVNVALKSAGNPYPFKSPEWHAHNQKEISSRPVTNQERKPLTPEQIDSFRPKPAAQVVLGVDAFPSEEVLLRIIGHDMGTVSTGAAKLVRIITGLNRRIEVLEKAQNPAMAAVEKRG